MPVDHANIIHDLINWLESHMDQPLSLDNVAAKSGYSKWHLQRMFKDITGQAIVSYIRARRLTKAAIALRLTRRKILDIALQYHFDSQQSFTRAFKKQFAQSPSCYRYSAYWNSAGIHFPLLRDAMAITPNFTDKKVWLVDFTNPQPGAVSLNQISDCDVMQLLNQGIEEQYIHDNDQPMTKIELTSIDELEIMLPELLKTPEILHREKSQQIVILIAKDISQNYRSTASAGQ